MSEFKLIIILDQLHKHVIIFIMGGLMLTSLSDATLPRLLHYGYGIIGFISTQYA